MLSDILHAQIQSFIPGYLTSSPSLRNKGWVGNRGCGQSVTALLCSPFSHAFPLLFHRLQFFSKYPPSLVWGPPLAALWKTALLWSLPGHQQNTCSTVVSSKAAGKSLPQQLLPLLFLGPWCLQGSFTHFFFPTHYHAAFCSFFNLFSQRGHHLG